MQIVSSGQQQLSIRFRGYVIKMQLLMFRCHLVENNSSSIRFLIHHSLISASSTSQSRSSLQSNYHHDHQLLSRPLWLPQTCINQTKEDHPEGDGAFGLVTGMTQATELIHTIIIFISSLWLLEARIIHLKIGTYDQHRYDRHRTCCLIVDVTSGVDLASYRSHLGDGISLASAFMGRPLPHHPYCWHPQQ